MFMLGMASQKGALPLTPASVEEAIRLNGQAVKMNIAAFRWGRKAAHDPQSVEALMSDQPGPAQPEARETVAEIIDRRAEFLRGYQNKAWAAKYRETLQPLVEAEVLACGEAGPVSEAAARSLFKLMAIKDEYEVARLYSDGSFKQQLGRQFESYDKLEYHMAPPVLGRKDASGHPKKTSFGGAMRVLFPVLAAFKVLRGTPLDMFGYSDERRMEREILSVFVDELKQICVTLRSDNSDQVAEFLAYPMKIKGYGHVKERNFKSIFPEKEKMKKSILEGVSSSASIAAE
jgi:indolepyruvate ferredoxin oxidoreductase